MDLVLNYQQAKQYVKENGFPAFVKHIEAATEMPYYQCSTYWTEDPKYICKLKGVRGDCVITWDHSKES